MADRISIGDSGNTDEWAFKLNHFADFNATFATCTACGWCEYLPPNWRDDPDESCASLIDHYDTTHDTEDCDE